MSSLARRTPLPDSRSTSASAPRDGAPNRGRRRLLLGAPALAGALAMSAPAQAQAGRRDPWCATWGCAPAGPTPTANLLGFSNQTLRLIARASIGASRVRVRLSNEMGGTELRIGAARIGLRGPGATVVAGTNFPLFFGGRSWVSIPAGAPVLSDPVTLPVAAFAELAVSLYLPGAVQASTLHSAAFQTSYASTTGDHSALNAMPVQRSFSSWSFLTEIDSDSPATALVVAGDSITDGIGSTVNANRRWPDWLARRLQLEPGGSTRYAVVNRGISANRMLLDTPTALLAGHDLLERFDRDVLATPGVRVFGVLIGINDIIHSASSAMIRPEDMIAGYRQLIERAHAHGIAAMGGTLLPFTGYQYASSAREAVRQGVNAWMRNSGAFDVLADFDLALRDPAAPARLRTDLDSGDHLHPNDAGYAAMAAAVPLAQLGALLGAP